MTAKVLDANLLPVGMSGFGKSLLISTFESLFKHELRDFQGLTIELWKGTNRRMSGGL